MKQETRDLLQAIILGVTLSIAALLIALLPLAYAHGQTIDSVHSNQDRAFYTQLCKAEVAAQYEDDVINGEMDSRDYEELILECETDTEG